MNGKVTLVALGASLPGPDGAPPVETCRRAAAALDGLPGFRLKALSRWWESDPVPRMPSVCHVSSICMSALGTMTWWMSGSSDAMQR